MERLRQQALGTDPSIVSSFPMNEPRRWIHHIPHLSLSFSSINKMVTNDSVHWVICSILFLELLSLSLDYNFGGKFAFLIFRRNKPFTPTKFQDILQHQSLFLVSWLPLCHNKRAYFHVVGERHSCKNFHLTDEHPNYYKNITLCFLQILSP